MIPRVAFLILAHQHPDLFARLVNRLQAPWSTIIAHIDRKADQNQFASATKGSPVIFVPENLRVNVQWGSIGVCLATIRMMRMALPNAERICLLSGADYPVLPITEIGQTLAKPVEFLRIDRVLDPEKPGIHNDFIRHMHFNNIELLNPRAAIPEPIKYFIQKPLAKVSKQIVRRPLGIPLVHGSCWWALTHAAATAALSYIDHNPRFMRWLRYTNCPDEFMMQSLVKSGPLAARITQDMTVSQNVGASHENLHGCHYIDWHYKGPGGLPKTLDLNDLTDIYASSALFARKIHPEQSRSLLDALDSNS